MLMSEPLCKKLSFNRNYDQDLTFFKKYSDLEYYSTLLDEGLNNNE